MATTKEILLRLSHFDDWANREVMSALETVTPLPVRSIRLLAHTLAAERLWLSRIAGESSPVPVWPEWSVDDIAAQLDTVKSEWVAFFGNETTESLDRAVRYTNSRGEPYSSAVVDIVTHVFTHGSHHRGQIAALLRANGHAPPYVDFIHGKRQGLFE